MNQLFSNISVLVWDFDGTLYKPNPELWHEVREAEYRVIMEHMGWDHKKTEEEFFRMYKAIIPSATETVAQICSIPTEQAAKEMENYYDRRKFVSRDERLMGLFAKLTKFRHFILANGVKHRLEETLDVIGVPIPTFEEIITSETVGHNKPNPDGYNYILEKTNLAPDVHLMIGDRETVDLEPAKTLGMKTCLVFSEDMGTIADITVPTVYDIEQVLL